MLSRTSRGDWGRRYPPLAVVAVALALALFALPSALNLPQANPGQTLEYAPVTGSGTQADAGGAFAGLGLGSSNFGPEGGLGDGAGPGGLGALAALAQTQPSQFGCVGIPPRQTEDPLSPPCVSSYSGNNGGSTWGGVSATDFKVVFRFVALDNGGNCYAAAESNNCGPPSGIYDMDNPSQVSTFFLWRYLHDYEVYFNTHYQTYKRKAHFYAYNFGDTASYVQNGYGPQDAEAEAAEVWNKIHPFASIDESDLESDSYTSYLAQRGVLQFGGASYTQALATNYPGLYWAFLPSPERRAAEYATYVCTKIYKPGPVTFSGNQDHGQPRFYGMLKTDDSAAPEVRRQQDLAEQALKQTCGLVPAITKYFHYATGSPSVTGPNSGWGTTNMVQMMQAHVTTILWPGGMEGEDMNAAHNLKWYPEWVALGDGTIESNGGMASLPSDETVDTVAVTPEPLVNAQGYAVERACYDTLLEVDPQMPQQTDVDYACNGINGGNVFDDTRQLYIGVQLAGPNLTPRTMNQGLHAIPARPSTSPYQPSCFYLQGDYSCVKDAVAEWFDPTTRSGSGADASQGCFRMWLGGTRFLPGQWPQGDAKAGKSPTDVCNLFTHGVTASVRPPSSG